jgi:hypothetical protein
MFATTLILLADKSAVPAAWGVLIFCILLGVIIALSPSRRTTEIKRPKED